MKREAAIHSKTGRLARVLGLEHWGAIGVLEALWHLTAREAPAGDIGKLSNEDIAYGIWWKGDPDRLVQALVDCKWVDISDESRLLIHDWREHADDGVHQKLVKTRKLFADGSVPSLAKLPKSEREEVLNDYKRIKALNSAVEREKALALPSLALPSLASAIASAGAPPSAPRSSDEESTGTTEDPSVIIHNAVREMLPNHPKPSPSGWAEASIEHEVKTKQLDAGEFCEQLKTTHTEHRRYWEQELARDPKAFVPIFHVWIREGYYLNRNCTKDPPLQRHAGKGARLHQELAELKSPEGRA